MKDRSLTTANSGILGENPITNGSNSLDMPL